MNKATKFVIRVISIIIAITLIFLSINSLFYTADLTMKCSIIKENEKVSIDSTNFIQVLILTVIWGALIYLIYKLVDKIENKKLLIFVIGFVIVMSYLWIILAQNPPRADQLSLVVAAQDLIEGNFDSFLPNNYLNIFPFQLGFVLFLEIAFSICKNIYFIQFINIICVSVITFCIYYITKRMFKNDKIDKIILILLSGYFYLELFTTFIYGNIPGLMFALLSIAFMINYFETRKNSKILLAIIFIIIANILKTNFLIYLITEIILICIDIIETKKWKNFVMIPILIVLLFSSNISIKSFYQYKTGQEISKGIPKLLWINMGLNYNNTRANGWYDASTLYFYKKSGYNYQEAKNIAKNEIRLKLNNFIKNPGEAIGFFKEKILSQWIEPTHQSIWINIPIGENDREIDNLTVKSIFEGKLNRILVWYFKIYQTSIYILSSIYFIMNMRKINYKQILLAVAFIGGFLFQLIWEAKSLYTFIFVITLLPYAANTLQLIFEKIDNKILKKRKLLMISGK